MMEKDKAEILHCKYPNIGNCMNRFTEILWCIKQKGNLVIPFAYENRTCHSMSAFPAAQVSGSDVSKKETHVSRFFGSVTPKSSLKAKPKTGWDACAFSVCSLLLR